MSLIKCKNCKKDISTSVKFCPHCGESNVKLYCRECGKEMELTDTACSNCGYIVNYVGTSVDMNSKNTNGNQYEVALIGLISSFFMPVVGLILGIIALKANKGLKNQAKTFGLVATIVSGVSLVFTLFLLFIYFILVFISVY